MRFSDSKASSCVQSLTFAAVTTNDSGTPRSSTSACLLLPFFPPVRGIGANGFLCQRRFLQRSVCRLPSPGYTFHFVVNGQSGVPQFGEEARTAPQPEPVVDARTADSSEFFARQCIPLAARPQHVDNGGKIHAVVINRLPAPARFSLVLPGSVPHFVLRRQARFGQCPEFIRDFPCFDSPHAVLPVVCPCGDKYEKTEGKSKNYFWIST